MYQTLVNGVPWSQDEIAALKKRNLSRMPLPIEFEKNGKPWIRAAESCPRCGGSGRYPSREYQGVCLQCQGDGYILTQKRILSDKEKAQRERARARKQARAQKAWEARQEELRAKEETKRAQEEAEAKAKAEKLAHLQWVGEEGQKVELTLKLIFCKAFDSPYGTKLFHLMEDPQGNKIIYSGTTNLFPEGTDTITRTFKIKSHEESEQYGKSTKVGLR